MVKPGGTGRPSLHISARLLPLLPSRSLSPALPSACPSPKLSVHFVISPFVLRKLRRSNRIIRLLFPPSCAGWIEDRFNLPTSGGRADPRSASHSVGHKPGHDNP